MKGKHAAAHAKKSNRSVQKDRVKVEPGADLAKTPVADSGVPRAAVEEGAPARTFDMDSSPSLGHRIMKGLLIVLSCLVALVLLVYLAGIVVFMGRFYPNTTMGSLDVSLKSKVEASAMLSDYVEDDYSIAIHGDGFNLDITSEECAMSIDAESVVSSALADNQPWLWPLKLNSTFDATEYLQASCNDSELGAYLEEKIAHFNETAEDPQDAVVSYSDKAHRFVIKPEVAGTKISTEAVMRSVAEAVSEMEHEVDPQDAVVSYSDKAHRFVIKPEVAGTKISTEAVMRSVAEAVSEMEHEVHLDSSHLVQAAVKSGDEALQASLDSANALLSCDVKLTLSGKVVASLGPDEISGWVVFADDGTASMDEAARDAWVAQVSDTYSTVNKERTYTRPDGKTITVNAGTYGWMVDTEAFSQLVSDSLASGATGDAEIPCYQTGNGYSDIGDWGAFCDIDLTEQHARFYDAGGTLVWESDIVSGTPGADGTPTGVYMCNHKMRNVNLKGPIDPETDKPKWDSPVDYWIPFIGNLIGLHDASWQSAFGGSRYVDGFGSRGCVNLPLSAAASIYDLIQPGDTVIVHW